MGDRRTTCPCCDQPVISRDHVHPADEAIRMLTAKIAEREASRARRP